MRQDEQESQIVALDFDDDEDLHLSSSPMPHNRLAENGGAESFVAETQYGYLVKDSQATETQPFEVNRSFAANRDASFANPPVSGSFFSKPTESIEPQDLHQGFKWGTNKKPVAGQYNRPVPKASSNNSATIRQPPPADRSNVPPNAQSLNVTLPPPQVQHPQINEPQQLDKKNLPASISNVGPASYTTRPQKFKENDVIGSINNVDPASHAPGPEQSKENNVLASINNIDPASHKSGFLQPEARESQPTEAHGIATSVRKNSSGSHRKPASISIHPVKVIPHQPEPSEQFKIISRQEELPSLQNISIKSEQLEDKLRSAGTEQIHHRQSTAAQTPAHALKPPIPLSEMTPANGFKIASRTKTKHRRPVVAFPSVTTVPLPEAARYSPRRNRQQEAVKANPRFNLRNERPENVPSSMAQSNTGRVRTPDNNHGFGRGNVGSGNLGLNQATSVAREDKRPPMRYDDHDINRLQMRHQPIDVNEKDHDSHPPMVRSTGRVATKQVQTTLESHNQPNPRPVQNLPHVRESNADQSDQGHDNLNASKPPNQRGNNDSDHDHGLRAFAQIPQDPIQQGHPEVIEGGDLHLDEVATAESTDHELSDPQAMPEASSRQASPARTISHSRPASRRSNLSRILTRPSSPKRTGTVEAKDVLRNRSGLTNKVKKSHNVQSASTKPQNTNVAAKLQGTSDLLVRYEKFLASGKQYADVLQDYEFQKQRVESQKGEIEELRQADEASKEQIAKLKSEKTKLDEKIKKLHDLCSKYKSHMNDVVKSQKVLKIQAAEMKAKTTEILNIRVEAQKKDSEAHARGEAMLKKIGAALKEAKEFRAGAEIRDEENARKVEEQLALENEQYAQKNKKLSKDLEMSETAKKALTTENIRLAAENEKLEGTKKRLENERKELQDDNFKNLEEQENLKNLIVSAKLLNKSLQADVDRNMVELGREKHTAELLQKTVEGQLIAHKDLLKAIKQAPATVARELGRGDGVLATITASVNTTQSKIDEATNLLNSLAATSSETPPAIVKLIENLSSRIDKEREAAEQTRSSLQESTNKLVEDLKGSIDQLRVDRENEKCLNARVQELGQINDGLCSEKKALEDGAQDLRTEIEKLHQEVSSYDAQLKNKNDELAAALAAPKEDPQIKVKLQQLESTNNGLESQLEIASQHITKLKEDVRKIQETLNRKEQHIKDLESKYDDAQTTIKSFDEARARYDTEKEQEKEIAVEDATRTAEANQAAVTSTLEAEVQKLDRLQKEGEAELITAREELQTLREANESLDSTAKDCQAQVDAFKDNFAKQIAVLNNLQARTPGRQTTDKLHGDLESLRIDIGNVKGNFKVTKGINHRNHQDLLDQQLQMEEKLLAIDVLEKQRDSAEHEVSLLKAQNESQKEELARQASIRKEKESAERELSILRAQNQSQQEELARRALLENQKEIVEHEIASLKAQNERQKEELARQAAQNTENKQVQRVVTPVQQIINDDNVLRHFVISETPENALRQATKQAIPSSGARGNLRGDHLNRVGGAVEKTPIRTSTTMATSPGPSNSSTPRSLRVAVRKGSNLAYLQTLDHANHRVDSLQTSKLRSQTFPEGNDQVETNQHLQISRKSSTIQSPQESTLADAESSPLTTDTDELQVRMDDIDHKLAQAGKEAVQNSRLQGKKAEENTRKQQSLRGRMSKSKGTVSVVSHQTTSRSSTTSLKRNYVPPEYVFSDDEPTPKKMKFSETDIILPSGMPMDKEMSAASMAEASRKRRESQPGKSALKKSAEGAVLLNSFKTDETQKLASRSVRPKGHAQLPAPHRGPSMYKGVVQGRNLKASTSASLSTRMNESESTEASTSAATIAPTKQAIQLSGQGASTTAGPGRKVSRIRTAAPRRPLRTVIPDSQESYCPPEE